MTHDQRDPTTEALVKIDRARTNVAIWIAAAGLVEGGLLVAFIALADFSDRVHVLLLISSLLVYATLGLGLVALGSYIRWSMLRVIEALDPRHPQEVGTDAPTGGAR